MSTDTTEHGQRTTCEECGLPYYVDNGACPYCGSASGDESARSNARSASRSRATCEECGLPYYADENDDCPYCESTSTADEDQSPSAESASESGPEPVPEPATSEAEAEPTELESDPEPAGSEPEPEPRARDGPPTTAETSESTDAEPSLLERISSRVRTVLRGR